MDATELELRRRIARIEVLVEQMLDHLRGHCFGDDDTITWLDDIDDD